jgi:S1-C subfamily serine protease
VFIGSPADKGGIFPGDFIVSLNGEDIRDHLHLTNKLGDQKPGRFSEFEIVRYGKATKLSIKLSVREEERQIIAQNKSLWPGMSVLPLSQRIREQLNIDTTAGHVIVYDVLEGTPAGLAGFLQEDVVTHIDNAPIRSLMDFYKALNNSRANELDFRVLRKGEETAVKLVRS